MGYAELLCSLSPFQIRGVSSSLSFWKHSKQLTSCHGRDEAQGQSHSIRSAFISSLSRDQLSKNPSWVNERLSWLDKVAHCPVTHLENKALKCEGEEGKGWCDTVSIICLAEQRLIYTVSQVQSDARTATGEQQMGEWHSAQQLWLGTEIYRQG